MRPMSCVSVEAKWPQVTHDPRSRHSCAQHLRQRRSVRRPMLVSSVRSTCLRGAERPELSVKASDSTVVVRALTTTTIRALRARILKALASDSILPPDWSLALDADGADVLDERQTLDRCGLSSGDELFITSRSR